MLIGAGGLVDEFQLAGYKTVGGPDHDRLMVTDDEVEVDPDVEAVVGGTDPYFNYYKCTYAQLCMNQNKDCKFISTNEDAAGHIIPTQIWPGAGAIIGALKGCTGRSPVLVGKPSDFLIKMISDKVMQKGIKPSETMMIGDRLDTDVDFGKKAGFNTSLVLSGCATMGDLTKSQITPNYILGSVADLIRPKKVFQGDN